MNKILSILCCTICVLSAVGGPTVANGPFINGQGGAGGGNATGNLVTNGLTIYGATGGSTVINGNYVWNGSFYQSGNSSNVFVLNTAWVLYYEGLQYFNSTNGLLGPYRVAISGNTPVPNVLATNIVGGAVGLIVGPSSSVYDAGSVTNVQGSSVIGPVASATTAANFTGNITLTQLPAQTVTNNYNLKSFGAYGDAHSTTGALALSNTPTITVTGGYFVAGDVGSFIRIKNADLNRNDWCTTITAVNSPTSITVATAVPVSYNLVLPGNVAAITTGYQIDYGQHDDTLAAQAFLNQETNWGGKFYIPPGHYLIWGPPTNNNAQLVVPCSPNAGNNNSPYMELYGSIGSQPWYSGSQPNVQWDSNTTVFISNLGTSANPGGWTNGIPSSVIDFRVQTNTYGLQLFTVTIPGSGGKITNNPILPFIHDLVIDRGFDAGGITLNLLAAGQAELSKLWIGNFGAQVYLTAPSNTNHWDIVMPDNFNGSGDFCYDINTGAGYNAVDFGLGYGNVWNFYCNSNAITSVFTGGSGEVRIDNVQVTCCNNLLYGSGGGQPYDVGSGAASGTFIPEIRVSNYQTSLTGSGTPDWMTNGVCLVYDPGNKIANGGVNSTPAHVYYNPGSGSGAAPWKNQVSNPNVWVEYDTPQEGHVRFQPQKFSGPVTMTNGLMITNVPPLVLGSGVSGQAYSLQMYSPGDYNYIEYWPGPSRFIRWLVGIDDRLVNGYTNSYVWYPYGGPTSGFNSQGAIMSLDPWGNLNLFGQISATNVPIDGTSIIVSGGKLSSVGGTGNPASAITNQSNIFTSSTNSFTGDIGVGGSINTASVLNMGSGNSWINFAGQYGLLQYQDAVGTLVNIMGTRGNRYWQWGPQDSIDPSGTAAADIYFEPEIPGAGLVLPGNGIAVQFATNGSVLIYSNVVSLNGQFTGNGAGLSNIPASLLSGLVPAANLSAANITNPATGFFYPPTGTPTLTPSQTNIFIVGNVATNSFDATNAAFNALKMATNSFQGTNSNLSLWGTQSPLTLSNALLASAGQTIAGSNYLSPSSIATPASGHTNLYGLNSSGAVVPTDLASAAGAGGGGGNVYSNTTVAGGFSSLYSTNISVGVQATNNPSGLVVNAGTLSASPGSANSTAWQLGNRSIASLNTFPVASMSPVIGGASPFAFDIMPAPGAMQIAEGNHYFTTWVDICHTNCITNNPAITTLRLGLDGVGDVYVGTEQINGGPGGTFWLGYNDVNVLNIVGSGINVAGNVNPAGNGEQLGYSFGSGGWAKSYIGTILTTNVTAMGIVSANSILSTNGIYLPTNNVPTISPLAGAGTLFFGGLGGTNLYVTFQIGGVNYTNRIPGTPGYP